MKILKLCYFACLVFAFLSLDTLVEESYEVVYEKGNQTEPLQYLVCERLSDLHLNKTEIDLQALRDVLYNYFNSSIQNDLRTFHPMEFEELVQNRTRSGGYLLLNGRFCLVANDFWELEEIRALLTWSDPSGFTKSSFSHRKLYYAFKRDTFDFFQMQSTDDRIGQLVVLKKEHPYSDCSASNARFRCLNECFKSTFRLVRYFYQGNETGRIQLNRPKNRTIEESEKNCFRKCRRENCKLVQLMIIEGLSKDKKIETTKFEAHLKLTAFDYWLQFIGLLCSFAGLSLNEFASVVIEFTQSRVRRRIVKIVLFCLKFTIILLGLASLGYLCTRVALDHTKDNHLAEKEVARNLIPPKSVHLAICVRIRDYFHDFWDEGRTMSGIENATNGALDDALEGIYVSDRGRPFRVDYHVHPKVLFKGERRCFPLSIQTHYAIIPSYPKLTIKFKKYFNLRLLGELYLFPEKEHLNGNSFKYDAGFGIQQRIVDRSKSSLKCTDEKLHEKLNFEKNQSNCTGRFHCVDRCMHLKLIGKYKRIGFLNLPYQPVLDRDWFNLTEWSTLHLMRWSKENERICEHIHTECLQQIPNEKLCEETNFEKTVEKIRQLDDQTIEIDLLFDVVRSVEEEPSWYKLSLDILSIESIVFGLTALSILQTIGSFVQTIWKESKLVIFLVYLLCSFGASLHTYHILHSVISGELIPTEHYELFKRIRMPEMMFCLQIDQNLIDEHHQLTGNYLEQLTSQMSPERIFANITYLNESNEWTLFDLHRVEPFFFLDMKCFRIDLDQEYDRDQFHFSGVWRILTLNFTFTTLPSRNRKKLIHFITKSKETKEFSKILNLYYSFLSRRDPRPSERYSITHETSLYEYEDRFSFIRRHFPSTHHNDAIDSYNDLQGQLLELQSNEHSLRTLNLPLEDQFGVEIRERISSSNSIRSRRVETSAPT